MGIIGNKVVKINFIWLMIYSNLFGIYLVKKSLWFFKLFLVMCIKSLKISNK